MYWREWTRSLSIPFEWQEAVIRAAITLKLCCFEETGAVIAAMTTSIPEAAGTERNWDYRYCWLRDAYFVVNALNRLSATGTMEEYLDYISNIAAEADDSLLQPVYGIALEKKLIECTIRSLRGYRNHRPVRIGNQAYEHVQNDIYGSVIMAATQAFSTSASPTQAISVCSNAWRISAVNAPGCTTSRTRACGNSAASPASILFRR